MPQTPELDIRNQKKSLARPPLLQESRGRGEAGVEAGRGGGTPDGGGGINFIGSDGSVLDKLPSGMEELVMDPEAMRSLDYGLSGLASLAPPQGRQKEVAILTCHSGSGTEGLSPAVV